MNILFFDLSRRLSLIILKAWCFVAILMYGSNLLGINVNNELILIGLVLAIFWSASFLASTGWLNFWKSIAPTLQKFWHKIGLIYLFILVCNLVIALGFIYAFNDKSFFLFLDSRYWLDLFWFIILTYAMMFFFVLDFKNELANNFRNPLQQRNRWVISLLGLGIVYSSLMYLPLLLTYLILGIYFILNFLGFNNIFNSSFTKTFRNYALVVLLSSLTLLGLVSYGLAVKFKSVINPYFIQKAFLTFNQQPKKISLDQVKTPTDWKLWFHGWLEHKAENSPQSLIEGLDVLAELCPPHPADLALVIECYEQDQEKSGQNFYLQPDLELALKLLSQTNEYANLFGLLFARGTFATTDEITSEIKKYLQHIRLSGVAENTLTKITSKEDIFFRLQIYPTEYAKNNK